MRPIWIFVPALVIAAVAAGLAGCDRDFSRYAGDGDLGDCASITKVEPEYGVNTEAVDIVIQGENFSPATVASMYLGASELSSPTVVTSTLVTAQVPSGLSEGLFDLIVISEDQCTATLDNAFNVIDPESILILSVSPSSVFNDKDTPVTLTGANFVKDVTTATVGEAALKSVTWVSDTELRGTVPEGLEEGLYDITVTNEMTADGTDGSNVSASDVLPEGLEVVDSGAVWVDSITPASGDNDVDTAVEIRGRNFEETPELFLGEEEIDSVTFVNSTVLTATIPAGLITGTYDVIVINPDGERYALVDGFTVTEPEAGDDDDDTTGDDDTGTGW